MGLTIDQELAEISDLALRVKTNYKARLNADMVAMLTEIQTEIEEMKMQSLTEKEIWNNAIGVCSEITQQKINKLKENS